MNSIIYITDFVEKLILLSLVGLSIWSVAIIIDRFRFFRRLNHPGEFEKLHELLTLKKMPDLKDYLLQPKGFYSRALVGALSHQSTEGADRELASFLKIERIELEKGLSVLATLGANAPFIGLFGTVLGIIRSFAYLGMQSGSTAVMSGVSQALYATATGLFVAIPAVIAYNIYSKKIKDLVWRAESLTDLYLARTR